MERKQNDNRLTLDKDLLSPREKEIIFGRQRIDLSANCRINFYKQKNSEAIGKP